MKSEINKYIHTADAHNLQSAKEIVPFIHEVLKPTSVLDVGCGLGDFLKVFQDLGVTDILGIDGNWVSRKQLFIEEKYFQAVELECPINLGRSFDIALCLEVAEHLAPDAGEPLVDTLCRHSDNIVFSAAIPGQGGQNHVNEQPFSFWLKQFEDKGYKVIDLFRDTFWDNKNIHWWYRQNMFLITTDAAKLNQYHAQIINANDARTVAHIDALAAKNGMLEDLQARLMEAEGMIDALNKGSYTWPVYLTMIKRKLHGHIKKHFQN